MSAEIPKDTFVPAGWRGWSYRMENGLTAGVLALMAVLPLIEILLRKANQPGITNVGAIVQHLTLLVGVLGGALAARDRRLLSLAPSTGWIKGQWRMAASVLSQGWAAGICVWLCAASVAFVISQKEQGTELAYGIQRWHVQCALPVGFAVVAVRLLIGASSEWRGRIGAFLVAALMLGLGKWAGLNPERWDSPALWLLGLCAVLGAPVFTIIGGAALILFWGAGEGGAIVALKHYSLVTNSMLPSIPLFTLAGYLMAEGGASKRLIRVFQACFSAVRGGPALVTVLACAFFTSFTGASGVTILALGGLLMPVLLAARYSEKTSLGLLTSSGSLGLLFPPCLPLILYVIVANTSAGAQITLKEMFLAGLGPGLLLVGLTAWWGIRAGPRLSADRPSFSAREAGQSIWAAKWELTVPAVALGALFSGWATPVEAAAVTAVYAFFTQCVVHRDLSFRTDLPRVVSECGLLVGGVLLILGVALGFTHWLIDAQIPDVILAWVTERIHSKWVFLLAVNVLLLAVGCMMDIFSAIVVVAPILAPIASQFGVSPLHFGVIFLANMELGFLTPPVGM
ncbi:MAG: TRAP transporter large permease subunit, partial [Verrucomicrobia bacterium]|nr:TRAP transporter large permease subunit [Verrucomicrobiota bacterium]